MAITHLISLADVDSRNIHWLVDRALEFAASTPEPSLSGKLIGIYFKQTSTRTRTSFTAAALQLGASCITYGPHDLQTNTGETIVDTTRVLSQMLDAIVIRTSGGEDELRLLANQDRMAVINAMNASEHPTQAVSDLMTIKQHLGALHGVHLLYLGEGNSTAAALALALSRVRGAKLTLLTPLGYGLPPAILERSKDLARCHGAVLEEFHTTEYAPSGVDVVYTTRWQTTGTSKPDPDWRSCFQPFRVTADLMRRVSKGSDTVFMHDLPAVRGEDVDAEVLDGPNSIAFRQAGNKRYAAMAVLEWSLLGCLSFHCQQKVMASKSAEYPDMYTAPTTSNRVLD